MLCKSNSVHAQRYLQVQREPHAHLPLILSNLARGQGLPGPLTREHCRVPPSAPPTPPRKHQTSAAPESQFPGGADRGCSRLGLHPPCARLLPGSRDSSAGHERSLR